MARIPTPLGAYRKTPRWRVYGMLRQIFLRSRERAYALKRDGYTCSNCRKKLSRKKGSEVIIHVHHKNGIRAWKQIFELVDKEILCHPDNLICLCSECHKVEDAKGNKKEEIKEDNPSF